MASAAAVSPGSGATAGRERGAPAGSAERRLVSVLFADLVGFTSLADGRDAEETRELLTRYYELARDIVERYGGSIEKFIGDAVMAVWGTPVTQEDDAERAVRAGLELVDGVRALATTPSSHLGGPGVVDRPLGGSARPAGPTARAGVLTGEAVVTIGATGQGMVAGDLVNTASRLQAVAEPGTVLVGEATMRAAGGAIVFEAAGEQSLRGKAAPVAAWRAVRVVAGRGGSGRASRLEPPFVGRDDEFRLLRELFHATAREGRPRLVSVTGAAGIGKNRLAWEFEKYLDGVVETVYWHQGRSPAYGEGIAWWALGEMVRQRARIAETDDRTTALERLRAMLGDYLSEPAEHSRIAPRVIGLLGLGDMPPGSQEEVTAAWSTLFERIAERGPAVFVFEDLHWADEALLDFVEQLAASPRQRPIFVLTLARPELLERRPTWGAGLRRFTSLDLGPLGPDAMELLLLGLVPGIPQSALRAIRERAEGIPLYAVETVRTLLDQGRLTEQDGRYRLVGELGPLGIPGSLVGLIGARLDALPDDERDILGHASILGQSFTPAALASISGLDEAATQVRLDRLVRREVLEVDVDPRSPERGQYRFVQGLLREVAHGRLSRRDRLARHLAAAEYFARGGSDELAGVVATHYLEAYRSAPEGEAVEVGERARASLIAAAERARTLGSPALALGYLEDAATIPTDEARHLAVGEAIVETAAEAGRVEVALARARELATAHRARGDLDGVARAATWEGRMLINDGRPGAAVALLGAALVEVGGTERSPDTVRLSAELARGHLMSGRPDAAGPVIEVALPIAERLRLRQVTADLLISKGWVQGAAGRIEESTALLRGAVVLGERVGAFNTEARARMNLSSRLSFEDPREAFAVAMEGFERALVRGSTAWAASLFGNAAGAALEIGEWAWIEASARRLDLDRLPTFSRLAALGTLAGTAANRGETSAAAGLLDEMRSVARDAADPQIDDMLLQVEAAIELARGNYSAVLAVSSRAAFQPGVGSAVPEVACHAAIASRDAASLGREIARVREAGGAGTAVATLVERFEASRRALVGEGGALELFEQVIALQRGAGIAFQLGLTLADRAILLPGMPGAAEAAAEARAIFDRLGARPALARLEAGGWGVSSLARESAPGPTQAAGPGSTAADPASRPQRPA